MNTELIADVVDVLAVEAMSYQLNKVIDNKLSKSKKPGIINRASRWYLRQNRKPWVMIIGTGVSVGLVYIKHVAKEMQSFDQKIAKHQEMLHNISVRLEGLSPCPEEEDVEVPEEEGDFDEDDGDTDMFDKNGYPVNFSY